MGRDPFKWLPLSLSSAIVCTVSSKHRTVSIGAENVCAADMADAVLIAHEDSGCTALRRLEQSLTDCDRLQHNCVLTICTVKLDGRAVRCSGKPDVQVFALACFEKQHAAASLQCAHNQSVDGKCNNNIGRLQVAYLHVCYFIDNTPVCFGVKLGVTLAVWQQLC